MLNEAILKFFIKHFQLMALKAFKFEVEKMAWDPYLNFAETKMVEARGWRKGGIFVV